MKVLERLCTTMFSVLDLVFSGQKRLSLSASLYRVLKIHTGAPQKQSTKLKLSEAF